MIVCQAALPQQASSLLTATQLTPTASTSARSRLKIQKTIIHSLPSLKVILVLLFFHYNFNLCTTFNTNNTFSCVTFCGDTVVLLAFVRPHALPCEGSNLHCRRTPQESTMRYHWSHTAKALSCQALSFHVCIFLYRVHNVLHTSHAMADLQNDSA